VRDPPIGIVEAFHSADARNLANVSSHASRVAVVYQERRMADEHSAHPLRQPAGRIDVVGKNGALTGYAGGLKRKRYLLDLEEPVPAVAGRLF
jgi:hypothetical protein